MALQHRAGAIQRHRVCGKRLWRAASSFVRLRFFMSRLVVTLVVILVVVIGGLFALSRLSHEKAPVRVEKVVPLANLSN
jgi:hypothetical protein